VVVRKEKEKKKKKTMPIDRSLLRSLFRSSLALERAASPQKNKPASPPRPCSRHSRPWTRRTRSERASRTHGLHRCRFRCHRLSSSSSLPFRFLRRYHPISPERELEPAYERRDVGPTEAAAKRQQPRRLRRAYRVSVCFVLFFLSIGERKKNDSDMQLSQQHLLFTFVKRRNKKLSTIFQVFALFLSPPSSFLSFFSLAFSLPHGWLRVHTADWWRRRVRFRTDSLLISRLDSWLISRLKKRGEQKKGIFRRAFRIFSLAFLASSAPISIRRSSARRAAYAISSSVHVIGHLSHERSS
jgi:hypothetical protein